MLFSIRNKFLGIFIGLSIFSIALVTYGFTLSSTGILRRVVTDSSLEMTKLHANNIGATLNKHIASLEFVASQHGAKIKDMNFISSSIIELRQSDYLIFHETFFVWPNGNIYAPGYDEFIVPNPRYYQSLFKNNQSHFISNPIKSTGTASPIFTVSVPISDGNDELVGYIAGTIELERISKELNTVKFAENSFGWIIDKDGYIIAHPDFAYTSYVNIYDLNTHGYEDVDAFIDLLMTEDVGIGQYNIEEDEKEQRIVTFTTIPHSPGWKLGISSTKEDAFLYILRLRTVLIVISSFVLIVTITITTIVTNNIVTPIQQLTSAAKKSKAIEDNTTRMQSNKEIKDLITAYNQMRESLRRHTDELEEIVDERTQELRAANKELFILASTDKLTGALNRGHLYKEINTLKDAVDTGHIDYFSILFIDLNNFKYYNDTFGHDIGDNILVDITKRLQAIIGDDNTLGRYGGDEFIILLPKAHDKEIGALIGNIMATIDDLNNYKEDLAKWLQSTPPPIPKNKSFGLSIGYSIYTKTQIKTVDALIKEADQHMYSVKQAYKAKNNPKE